MDKYTVEFNYEVSGTASVQAKSGEEATKEVEKRLRDEGIGETSEYKVSDRKFSVESAESAHRMKEITAETLKAYIKENNSKLGLDLYWDNSHIPLKTKGKAQQGVAISHIYSFLKIMVNGTLSDKLDAVVKYNKLMVKEDWRIDHGILYKTLLLSELAIGHYDTTQYPKSFTESIDYLGGLGNSFKPPIEEAKIAKQRIRVRPVSRYNRRLDKG